jgi:hypothetical protein
MPMAPEKAAAWARARYHERKAAGLCVDCGEPRGEATSRNLCGQCTQQRRERERALTARQPRWQQQVITTTPLWERGEGWWLIELACGHHFAVLHGHDSPLGERAMCARRCGTQAVAKDG